MPVATLCGLAIAKLVR